MKSKSAKLGFLLSCALGVSTLAVAQTSSPSTPGSHLAPCVPVNNGSGTRAQYRPGTPSNPPSTLPGTTVPGTTTPCVAQDGTVVTPSSSGTTGTAMQSGSQGSSGSQSGSAQPGSTSGGQSSGSGAQSPSGNSPGTNQQNSPSSSNGSNSNLGSAGNAKSPNSKNSQNANSPNNPNSPNQDSNNPNSTNPNSTNSKPPDSTSPNTNSPKFRFTEPEFTEHDLTQYELSQYHHKTAKSAAAQFWRKPTSSGVLKVEMRSPCSRVQTSCSQHRQDRVDAGALPLRSLMPFSRATFNRIHEKRTQTQTRCLAHAVSQSLP